MISSHSMPEPGSAPAAEASLRPAPVASLVSRTRQVGVALLAVGAVGGLVGLLSHDPLGVMLAIASGLAGAYLVRACQQLGPHPEWLEGEAGHATHAPGDYEVVLLKRGAALAGEALVGLRQAGVRV